MLDKHCKEQSHIIQQLSLQLRTAYYETHPTLHELYLLPFGGKMTESIGAFPEFILRGTFCKRSAKGLCSPCFYSRYPRSNDTRETYLNMLKSQLSYIVDNFKGLVINNQYEDNLNEVTLVLTPTGSYFDECEYPIDLRLATEKKLIDLAVMYKINITLHIESHYEDFLHLNLTDKQAAEEIKYLRKLNTRVVFGLESVDEYCRNVLYNKQLPLQQFEVSIKKAHECGLVPGAFVFAGLFSLNDAQTKQDVYKTVKYLLSIHVFPVIMFQNVQPYTITDVLLKAGKIQLLEPFTVADIIADILELTNGANAYWLIADPIGGPPEPDSHIFNRPKMTDPKSTMEIYNYLVELRKSREIQVFINKIKELREKKEYSLYSTMIQALPSNIESAKEITDILLDDCKQAIIPYLIEIGN